MSPWVSEKQVSRPHREELINHLMNLCRIFSPSGYELGIIEYCMPILEAHGFLALVSPEGNIYATRGMPALVSPEGNIYATRGMPDSGKYVLLNAHMDTVQTQMDSVIMDNPGLVQYDKFWNVISGRGCMVGGDDKAGVAAILTLVTQTDLPMKILLTVREETHAIGAEMIPPAFYDDVLFAISLDRRHCCDVIDYYCGYYTAPKAITDLIIQIGKESDMAMVRADGSYADTAVIAKFVPAVNLSIGYYNAHSPNDFIRVNEVYDSTMLTMKCIIRREEFADALSKARVELPRIGAEPPETGQVTFSRWSYQYGMRVPEKKIKKGEEEEIIAKRYEKCPIEQDCIEKHPVNYRGTDLIWAEGYNRAWEDITYPGRRIAWKEPKKKKMKKKAIVRGEFLPSLPLSLLEEKAFANIMSHLVTKYPVVVATTKKGEEITIELKAPAADAVKYHNFGWLIFTSPGKKTSYVPLYPDRASVFEINSVYVESGATGDAIKEEMFSLITQIDSRIDAEAVPDAWKREYLGREHVNRFRAALKIIDDENYWFKMEDFPMDLYSGVITYHSHADPLATIEIFHAEPSTLEFRFTPKFMEEIGIYGDYESMEVVYGIFFRRDRFREKMMPLMAEVREILQRTGVQTLPVEITRQVALPAAPKDRADQILDDPELLRQFAEDYGDWDLSEQERLGVMYCITQIAAALGKKQKIIKMVKKGSPALFQYYGSLIHPKIESAIGLYYNFAFVAPPLTPEGFVAPTTCYREAMRKVIMRVQNLTEIIGETREATPIAGPTQDITAPYNDLLEICDTFMRAYKEMLGREVSSFKTDLTEEGVIRARIEIGGSVESPSFTIELTVETEPYAVGDYYCEIRMIYQNGEVWEMGDAPLSGLYDELWETFAIPALEDQMEQLAEEGFSAQEEDDDEKEEGEE